jgi:hypothetical protein
VYKRQVLASQSEITLAHLIFQFWLSENGEKTVCYIMQQN